MATLSGIPTFVGLEGHRRGHGARGSSRSRSAGSLHRARTSSEWFNADLTHDD